jgi:predicted ATPase with chaperone activity
VPWANIRYFRTFAVAWTIADLVGRDQPCVDDVNTAMGFRQTGAER